MYISIMHYRHFDPRFLPNFSGDPKLFFNILTTGSKGCIIQKSEGVPDVRA